MTGWHAEIFARTPKLKGLSTYLEPPPKPSPERAARDVMHLFDRMLAAQTTETTDGDR